MPGEKKNKKKAGHNASQDPKRVLDALKLLMFLLGTLAILANDPSGLALSGGGGISRTLPMFYLPPPQSLHWLSVPASDL